MMNALLLSLTLLQPGARPEPVAVKAEIQGLYDEMSDATRQFETESDIDLLHEVLCTFDWTFIDATGTVQNWPQVRVRAIQALSGPRPDRTTQPIQKLTLGSNGATAVVNTTTVNIIIDHEGRYGRRDASHTLTETTTFRDRWVLVGDEWKLKSREQMGRPSVSVDARD